MRGPEEHRPVVESVVRAVRLLECFEPGEPELPLATFVRRSGYSKTTTHRLLTTLKSAGWLERTADNKFRLTMRVFPVCRSRTRMSRAPLTGEGVRSVASEVNAT